MASPKVAEALSQALSTVDPVSAFDSLLSNLKSLSTPQTIAADLDAFVDGVFASDSSALGVVAQRALLNRFVSVVRDDLDSSPDLRVSAAQHALAALSSQTATASGTFLDQAAALRELQADGHEAAEEHAEAARALAEIPLDSSQRRVTPQDRVRIWVRIVRNYLEVDDTAAAEPYLNKIKNVIYQVDDPALNLHFRLSQARIHDAKRAFLPASQAYHEISLSPAISEDERLHTLSMAVKCAILAPAGPLRSRALGRLFRDERSANLPEFGMLEKMFFDRLLAPAEVRKFAEGLAPHQLALTADGSTVLARAVVEHNLLGASRLYSNIGFDELGRLLGLADDGDAESAAARAEDTTARMMEQGRLAGRIDQIERGLAEEVENVTNALQREFPDFVAANLVV
ncbi:hypothetical protein AAE478_002578 [Parahypoxylon ruwenzoriense]